MIVFLIYTQVENHVLNPIVMSRTVKINPLLVFVAVLIGPTWAPGSRDCRRIRRGPARRAHRGDDSGHRARVVARERTGVGRIPAALSRPGLQAA